MSEWSELDKRRWEALAEVERAKEKRAEAEHDYEQAILNAHALGVSNVKMAKVTKLSETAIRMYIKRRKDEK